MIEIVYKEENPDSEQNIRLPKNVKQIGGEPGKRRIYMEDYVVTCVKGNSFSDEGGYGVLLGDIKRSGQETYLFINGAVEARAPIDRCGEYIFDDNVWTDIYEKIKQYFSEQEIVGWYVRSVADSYGQASLHEKMLKLEKIHLDNFAGSDRICFFYDCVEGEEAIYAYDAGMLRRYYGYYIYYEKNLEMREYLESVLHANVNYGTVNRDDNVKSTSGTYANTGRMKTVSGEIKNTQKNYPGHGSIYKKSQVYKILAGAAVAAIAFTWFQNMEQMNKARSSMKQLAGKFVAEKTTEVAENYTAEIKEVAGNVYPTTERVDDTTDGSDIEDNGMTQQGQTEQQTEQHEQQTEQHEQQTEAPTATISADTNYYIVAEGETLSTICRKIYGSQSRKKEVMELNNITDEDKIYVGQKIKLP